MTLWGVTSPITSSATASARPNDTSGANTPFYNVTIALAMMARCYAFWMAESFQGLLPTGRVNVQ
jgi:hypothetical protein